MAECLKVRICTEIKAFWGFRTDFVFCKSEKKIKPRKAVSFCLTLSPLLLLSCCTVLFCFVDYIFLYSHSFFCPLIIMIFRKLPKRFGLSVRFKHPKRFSEILNILINGIYIKAQLVKY